MGSLTKQSAVRKRFHQNQLRISSRNLEALEKELSKLVKERLEQIIRSAKTSGRKNILPEHWKQQ